MTSFILTKQPSFVVSLPQWWEPTRIKEITLFYGQQLYRDSLSYSHLSLCGVIEKPYFKVPVTA